MGLKVHRRKIAYVITACVVCPPLAMAQGQAAPPAKPKSEEITVTAQKRTENVRKVPVSVTVLSGRQLRAQHITNFASLTQAVPNLSYSSQAGEGLSTLEMRGIASQAGTATVALYLDDVSLTTRNLYTEGTAEPRFLDISRVEVLRGPQSTLYGASALGGTLKYISNPVDMTKYTGNLFSELSGTYHGTVNWDEQGVVNIPLIDNVLALRLAGETGTDGGYINNINPADGSVIKSNINSNAWNVVRGVLEWKPNDWLTVTPSVFFQRYNSRDVDAAYLALPNDQTPKVVAEPGKDSLIVPALTLDADLGFAALIAVTGNYERQFNRTLDSTVYDNLSLYICDPLDQALTCTDNNGNPVYNAPKGLYGSLFNLPSETYYNNTVRQWSEEIRLVSKPYVPGEGQLPFTWIAGLYYSDEHTVATDNEFVNGANAVFNKYGVSPSDPTVISGGFPGAIVNDQVYSGLTAYDTAQYAVFGEGTYYPLTNVRLTAGARYQYSRDAERTDQFFFYDYGSPGLDTELGHFYAFLPKFAAGWDVNPENTINANISKGFRLGSENRRIAYIPDQANAFGTPSYDLNQLGLHNSASNYGPDKLWNYEIGDKARFFGGRLLVNADVFYIDWSDIQTLVPLVSSGDSFETNAGAATSYGIEWEIRGRVTDGLTLGFSGSALKATLTDGVDVNGNRVDGTFAGEKVPGVPDYNLNMDAKQTFQLNDATEGFFSITIPWVGESHGNVIAGDPATGLAANPDYKRPSYVTLDLSTGIDWGRWEFTLFGKNLTNNNKIIQRPDIQGSGVDTPGNELYGLTYLGNVIPNTQGFTLRPLTVGFNAAVKF